MNSVANEMQMSDRTLVSICQIERISQMKLLFSPMESSCQYWTTLFRAGTRWALSISLIKMLKPISSNMRTQSFVVSIGGSLDPA